MSETREAIDPLSGKTVQIRNDLVRRLRGQYAVGPTLPSGEPEFGWRQFDTPPIQHEAADQIEETRKALQQALVAMKIAAALPGVSAEYDFGPAIASAEFVVAA